MLCKDTILVLRNVSYSIMASFIFILITFEVIGNIFIKVTIQNSEGLPLFIAITLSNIYMIYVDESNKVLGYGAKVSNELNLLYRNKFKFRRNLRYKYFT